MKISFLSLCVLLNALAAQQYNQDPTQFLSEAEQMPDSSYNDIMSMIKNVGSMENNLTGIPKMPARRSMKMSTSPRLEDANDPVDFMDTLHKLQKNHHHHNVHFPTTRLAHAVHLIHQKMNQRKAAERRRKFGTQQGRKLRRDSFTNEMVDELIGSSHPQQGSLMNKQGMGGMGGMDPNALQDINTIMSGGHLLHSDPMPLNNTSNWDGSLNDNVTLLGQKGIKELSKKMVDQFMPKIQNDVSREMRHKFGRNYLIPTHHHHHHHHHHRRPRCTQYSI